MNSSTSSLSASSEGTSITIDLSTLASDVNLPAADLTYSVSYPQNGTVALLADGHTAQFSPASGFSGQAEFSFTVTDPATGLNASAFVTVTVTRWFCVSAY